MGGDGGGKKPGSGRPRGAKSAVNQGRIKARTVSEHIIVATRAKGELPHEFLARVARGEAIDGYQPTFAERQAAASAAAPYFAPKLSTIEQKTEVSFRAVVSAKPLTEEQWLRMHSRVAEAEKEKDDARRTIEHTGAAVIDTSGVEAEGTGGESEADKSDLGATAWTSEGFD